LDWGQRQWNDQHFFIAITLVPLKKCETSKTCFEIIFVWLSASGPMRIASWFLLSIAAWDFG